MYTREDYLIKTMKVGTQRSGTGDIFASIIVADRLNNKTMKESLKDACEFISKSIEKTLPEKDHEYGVCFEQVLRDERTAAGEDVSISL